MKDLNEIYENQSFQYWCDADGELINPYAVDSCNPAQDITVMPLREQELYMAKRNNRPEYVVSWNYKAYTAYVALFDYNYLEDVMPDITEPERENNLRNYAETLTCPGCEILYGKDTDAFGHEIILMIPYEKREIKNDLIKMFEENVYRDFEKFITPEPKPTAIPKTLYTVSTLYENADTHEYIYRIRQICRTAEEAEREARTYMENFRIDMKEELARFNPGATTRYPLYGSLMESSYDQNDETAEHEYYNQISWGCGQDYRRYAVMADKIETED